MSEFPGPEPAWKTARLLWKTAHRRAQARAAHRRRLQQKKKSASGGLAGLAIFITAIFMAVLHGSLGYMTLGIIQNASYVARERGGQLVVSESFYRSIVSPTPRPLQRQPQFSLAPLDEPKFALESGRRRPKSVKLQDQQKFSLGQLSSDLGEGFRQTAPSEARWRAAIFGGTEREQEQILWNQCQHFGASGFVRHSEVPAQVSELSRAPALAQLCGTCLFCWWFLMLVMQGEGIELDVQRRRHPMWEWLLSHPVHPGATFLTEMVSPLVSNAAYLTAPVYWIVILTGIWDFRAALFGGVIIGATFAIAAAILNKTLELCAMLKLSMRSRGAVLGLMSWLGYTLFILPFFLLRDRSLLTWLAQTLAPVASIFHPNALSFFLGQWSGKNFLSLAFLASLGSCAALVAACIAVGKWGTSAGLEGGFDLAPGTPRLLKISARSRFGREPLHRKELLWFLRDRGAVVQAILLPLTIAAVQVLNYQQALHAASRSWNGFCGLAVISGTYFLLVLGPRSLASEGPALWITLTWPRGLEDLLKAKARLWWRLSTAVVFLVLIFAAVRFPAQAWQIALVALGWWFFARSLAEKSVTLVGAPTSSGEIEPLPRHRRWTALLGTLAFGSGVVSGNWQVATIGVVFSGLTAAALWQNLRARLPFLYDPWSEKLPAPPTLLHAMVAIAAMAEGIGLTTAIFAGFGGSESIDIARTLAYGVGAIVTCAIVSRFLNARGVAPSSLWIWPNEKQATEKPLSRLQVIGRSLVYGVGTGAALGLLAIGYRHLVLGLPALQQLLQRHPEMISVAPHHFLWLAALVIYLAPPAEEFLFRGLLYPALDREWGGWRAILGSAAFFAIYHPPLSWLPVMSLGVANAWLFRKSGYLAPCVLAHMTYNAIVVFTS